MKDILKDLIEEGGYPLNKKIRSYPRKLKCAVIGAIIYDIVVLLFLGLAVIRSIGNDTPIIVLIIICGLNLAIAFFISFYVIKRNNDRNKTVYAAMIRIIEEGKYLDYPIPEKPTLGKLYFANNFFTDCRTFFIPYSNVIWIYKNVEYVNVRPYGIRFRNGSFYTVIAKGKNSSWSIWLPWSDRKAKKAIENYFLPRNPKLIVGYSKEIEEYINRYMSESDKQD